MQIDFRKTPGRVQAAQQLISPPRLLPPIEIPFSSSILPCSVFDLNQSSNYFSIKSKYLSPKPPNFYQGSNEQVYSEFLSGVFQMPTMMISLIFPVYIKAVVAFWQYQAPNADFEASNRFWPSCIRSRSYCLQGLSQQEGGQYMLSFLEYFRNLEEMGELSKMGFSLGLKLGQILISVVWVPVRVKT